MIDLTTILIFLGLLLTGVITGFPIGFRLGEIKAWRQAVREERHSYREDVRRRAAARLENAARSSRSYDVLEDSELS
jgi:hypothetical protein